jgi:hypothetical protein
MRADCRDRMLRRNQPRVQELPRRAQRSHDGISEFKAMPGYRSAGRRILP